MLLPAWLYQLATYLKKRMSARSHRLHRKQQFWQSTIDNRSATIERLEDRTMLTPQVASSLFPTVVDGADSFTIDVTYQDDRNYPIAYGLNDTRALTVTGPGGPLSVVSATPVTETGGAEVTVQYTVIPPGGTWDYADNSSYQVEVKRSRISNIYSQSNPPADLGSFNVNLPLDGNYSPGVNAVTAPSVGSIEAGASTYSFTVEYSDDSAIDVSTIDVNDVSISGPGGSLTVISAVEASGVNGSPRSVTYTAVPPGGYWGAGKNGTYSIALNGLEVGDDGTPQLYASANPSLATFAVNVTSTYVYAQAPDVGTQDVGQTAYTFDVVYSDNRATISGFDSNDLHIQSPSGDLSVEYLSSRTSTIGVTIATYELTPPGGNWDTSDNGLYTVILHDNEVSGSSSGPFSTRTIGTFDVEISPPTVVGATFDIGNASLEVTFSGMVNGADVLTNYSLVRAGTDGLLRTADDVVILIDSASFVRGAGGTSIATLNFAALPEDIYHLSVLDTITNVVGNSLDGDEDGLDGGDFSRDFVVGATPTTLTSPGGENFDPETFGYGAGQLVQGSNHAFNGLNRLRVGEVDFSPSANMIPIGLTGQETTSTVVSTLDSTFYKVGTLTVTESGVYQVSGELSLRNLQNDPARVQYRFLINGVAGVSRFTLIPQYSEDNYFELNLEDTLELNAGDTVQLQVQGVSDFFELRTSRYTPQHKLTLTRIEGIPGITVQEKTSSTSLTIGTSFFNVCTLTAAESGVYQISGELTVRNRSQNAAAQVEYRFLINGVAGESRIATFPPRIGASVVLDLEQTLELNAGDTVQLQVRRFFGLTDLISYSYAPGHKLTLTRLDGVPAITTQETTSTTSLNLGGLGVITPPGLDTLTVAESGVYRILGELGLRNRSYDPSQVQYQFLINGVAGESRIMTIPANATDRYYELNLDEILELNDGDTIELQVWELSGSSYLELITSSYTPQHKLRLIRFDDVRIEYQSDDGERTVVTNTQNLSGLDVHREITVPETGSQDFARSVDVFHNPTASPITETVTIVGNLGSDEETVVFSTSDGDTIIEPTDLWIGTDDADGTDTPAIIHYIHGPQGLIPATVELVGDNIVWTYDLTVNAGETVRLAHLTILDENRADAEAAANALVSSTGFTGEAGAYLTGGELASLQNFQFYPVPGNPPDVVYVDNNFINPVAEQDPDGVGGPATQFGFDAFTTIQAAIAAVAEGGAIHIAAGIYSENVDATARSVTLAPGNSPGQVVINGNLTLDSDDSLEIEINGTTPGSGFDQFVVNGTVALNGADLNLIDGYDPADGDQFLLVDNDAADTVAGTFNGLPEGYGFVDFLGVSGQTAYLTYVGGDGNDVLIHVSNLETVSLRVVDAPTATDANGEAAALPTNQDWISEWASYWVEIWVSTEDLLSQGIATVSLDLGYQTDFTSATEIGYGPAFSQNQSGTIDDPSGLVGNLSATVDTTDLGINSQLLFARIKFESLADDQVLLDLAGQSIGPHDLGFGILNSQLSLGSERVNDAPVINSLGADIWANPYDLNDDDAINFRDLILFVSVYNSVPAESGSDYGWFSDFNQNNRVDFRDLILLASNYGRRKEDHSAINYPDNYPSDWNQLLQVSALPQITTKTSSLTQSQADVMLQTVVQGVSPDLSKEEQQRLSDIKVEVVDLEGAALGQAKASTIYIDINAAGYGWFVDQTPLDHSEYHYDSQLSLIALPGSEAEGRVDLWTVIRHELGHLLGYEHTDQGVMEATLVPGVRKLSEWGEETDLFFASLQAETELLSF
ncbi:hypothetical protein [Gimesia panareensis]|uniref:hypothetical protein n=1 Tax=Gimesia panareensis TaxID=2527978 RepID=UPI00118C9007|nr:hypothetical protein [Gimesia panareensis]QDU49595.1 hypothetical protein Pan110_19330 [Gimesia panareensis]